MRSMANENMRLSEAILKCFEDGSEKRNLLRYMEKIYPFAVEFTYSTGRDNGYFLLRKGKERMFLIVDLKTFEILEWEDVE